MTTIESVRHVVANGCSLMRPRKDTPHQWDVKDAFGGKKRGWFYMDSFTASMLVAVHDALRPELQEKFNRIPLMTLINFGWKQVKEAGEGCMILTLVCLAPAKYIVVEDEGFVSQYRGIPLRPASSREGSIVCGPCGHTEATRFITNRNRVKS